jgi:hypothetical protein
MVLGSLVVGEYELEGVQRSGFKVQGSVQGSGFKVPSSWFLVLGSWFLVLGSGFWVRLRVVAT